ncbi:MAG: hypothetical protein L3J91_02605 [Thermoplasmata archaeon]|nr:hypothetical protein [Thermoplasmata archaeon]
MKDRSELSRVVFHQTRVVLNRDLSVMNPNLVEGAIGMVVGRVASYTLKVAFPQVTVGINWQDCDIVEGKTGMPTDAEQPKMIPRARGVANEE